MTLVAPPEPAADQPAVAGVDRTSLAMAAFASAGAGLVHAAAAGTHNDDRTLALLFAATAVVQLGWAAVAGLRPNRPVALAGAVLNTVFVLAWMLSRTVGLPLIAGLREAEAVGTQDLLAALLGALAAGGAGAALILGARARDRGAPVVPAAVAVAGALVLALAVPGMAAPHDHGDHGHDVAGDDHADHADGAAGADHAMDHGAGQSMDHGMDHGNERRITSFDDPNLTPEQKRKARDLYDRTVAWTARFTDEASVVAAGYVSIGDSSSGFEHFINHTFEDDGIELDPQKVEAFVFETPPGRPKKLAAAMFILEPGRTMADVPEIAGSLTTWHLHDDLCWDPTGTRVVGLYRLNRCMPGGTLQVTPPMLHVWPEPQVCGPFAEADTLESPIDRILRRGTPTTTRPASADPCQHVHGAH